MPAYGIAIVPSGWNDSPLLTFNPNEYAAWQDAFVPGTHVLIYEATPTEAIVGEVVIADTASTESQRISVRVIRKRGKKRIPLASIRQHTTIDTFPREGEEWLPLGKSTYEELAQMLE